jgi:uncharacterized protein YbaR (Trm112 family)/2-polyprenyl-3-methyl-5-hydroxy-6-metoxy-1,4-benzoquinol methylase
MRKRLLRWLVCPLCQSKVNLVIKDSARRALSELDYVVLDATAKLENRDEIETEVITGALTCGRCHVYYPIFNAIPRMLTYPTLVVQIHAENNANWIGQNLSGFLPPSGKPPPGEERVLRSFSKEWQDYKWSGASYWDTTPETTLECMRYSLGIPKHSLRHKLVLEIGIGIGVTADALSRTEQCELVGMDLGYAVDQAQRYFGKNSRLHIVQASVFSPPFPSDTFDVVYSHGVLHHTYSTRLAFEHIAQLPKRTEGMLYVWVYSHEQEQATILRRVLMTVERVVRPILSRLPELVQTILLLPILPFYVVYQNLYRRKKLGQQFAATYGWSEALHAARDRLTPLFAHRHTYREVTEWFQSEMYQKLEFLRDELPPEGVPNTYPLNVGIRGWRT